MPIVECNNNEVIAASIVAVFKELGPTWIPFTKDRFKMHVTDGVGIWTTEMTKAASLQVVYQAMLEERVAVSDVVVTTDSRAHNPKAQPGHEPAEAVKLLADQLKQFSDGDDGKITGKIDGCQDDVGMAFLMAFYWRLCCLRNEPGADMIE